MTYEHDHKPHATAANSVPLGIRRGGVTTLADSTSPRKSIFTVQRNESAFLNARMRVPTPPPPPPGTPPPENLSKARMEARSECGPRKAHVQVPPPPPPPPPGTPPSENLPDGGKHRSRQKRKGKPPKSPNVYLDRSARRARPQFPKGEFTPVEDDGVARSCWPAGRARPTEESTTNTTALEMPNTSKEILPKVKPLQESTPPDTDKIHNEASAIENDRTHKQTDKRSKTGPSHSPPLPEAYTQDLNEVLKADGRRHDHGNKKGESQPYVKPRDHYNPTHVWEKTNYRDRRERSPDHGRRRSRSPARSRQHTPLPKRRASPWPRRDFRHDHRASSRGFDASHESRPVIQEEDSYAARYDYPARYPHKYSRDIGGYRYDEYDHHYDHYQGHDNRRSTNAYHHYERPQAGYARVQGRYETPFPHRYEERRYDQSALDYYEREPRQQPREYDDRVRSTRYTEPEKYKQSHGMREPVERSRRHKAPYPERSIRVRDVAQWQDYRSHEVHVQTIKEEDKPDDFPNLAASRPNNRRLGLYPPSRS